MECVELAPAVGCVARFESGSKLHALHTLRKTRPPPVLRPCNLSVFPGKSAQENNNVGYINSARRATISKIRRRAQDRRALPAHVTEALQTAAILCLHQELATDIVSRVPIDPAESWLRSW